jgi:hypothetical protein
MSLDLEAAEEREDGGNGVDLFSVGVPVRDPNDRRAFRNHAPVIVAVDLPMALFLKEGSALSFSHRAEPEGIDDVRDPLGEVGTLLFVHDPFDPDFHADPDFHGHLLVLSAKFLEEDSVVIADRDSLLERILNLLPMVVPPAFFLCLFDLVLRVSLVFEDLLIGPGIVGASGAPTRIASVFSDQLVDLEDRDVSFLLPSQVCSIVTARCIPHDPVIEAIAVVDEGFSRLQRKDKKQPFQAIGRQMAVTDSLVSTIELLVKSSLFHRRRDELSELLIPHLVPRKVLSAILRHRLYHLLAASLLRRPILPSERQPDRQPGVRGQS